MITEEALRRVLDGREPFRIYEVYAKEGGDEVRHLRFRAAPADRGWSIWWGGQIRGVKNLSINLAGKQPRLEVGSPNGRSMGLFSIRDGDVLVLGEPPEPRTRISVHGDRIATEVEMSVLSDLLNRPGELLNSVVTEAPDLAKGSLIAISFPVESMMKESVIDEILYGYIHSDCSYVFKRAEGRQDTWECTRIKSTDLGEFIIPEAQRCPSRRAAAACPRLWTRMSSVSRTTEP